MLIQLFHNNGPSFPSMEREAVNNSQNNDNPVLENRGLLLHPILYEILLLTA